MPKVNIGYKLITFSLTSFLKCASRHKASTQDNRKHPKFLAIRAATDKGAEISLSTKDIIPFCFPNFYFEFMDVHDQWPQPQQAVGMGSAMDEIPASYTNSSRPSMSTERRARPQEEQNLNCPRCNSTNTKFCYYNNYSLTQPRYFCKTCRRYWTQGGSLRNVPVGGGSRKNKRSTAPSSTMTTNNISSSSSTAIITAAPTSPSSSSGKLTVPDLNPPTTLSQLITVNRQNPSKIQRHGQDLNLAFPTLHDHQGIFQPVELPKIQVNKNNNTSQGVDPSSTSCSSSTDAISPLSALELLRTGIASRGLNSYIPMPMPISNSNTLYSSGFTFQEFKPSLSFSGDGIRARVGNFLGDQENNGARLLFPFGELKQLSSTTATEVDQNKVSHEGSAGYWNGFLGGGTW
ncbi:hypothetical protein Nepgr_002232 [Nepenthes gracilis]|uniref:Dof zinc finger protein n=1 Tax=Nepenthes gracilis TaxID=150966 RepID=A0AAD3RY58_NEPGR|nr:hypothetical protein Nepgr_002232 [Nepenthes gracilis]